VENIRIISFVAEYIHAKWPVVTEKHIKIEPKVYVLFVFELGNEFKIVKNKTLMIKEIYSCLHLGCID